MDCLIIFTRVDFEPSDDMLRNFNAKGFEEDEEEINIITLETMI